jgi:Xaa-Pro aminopeptidase
MNRIQEVRQKMSSTEYSAILITSRVNRLYVSGFNSSAGAMLLTDKDAYFFTDFRYIEAAKSNVTDAHINVVTTDETYEKQISAIIKEQGISKVGFENESLTFSEHQKWNEKLDAELVPAQDILTKLRAVKSRADLDKMIKAQRISEKAFIEVLPLVKPGITERQLAAELIYRILKNGADNVSFDPIIVSGVKSSLPHGTPGEEKIADGFVTFDFGAQFEGWCSDTTRTVCVGTPTDEMVNVYETVLKAQKAGIAQARAGVVGSSIDAAARDVIAAAGYGDYFGHGFGHGLGLEVHEDRFGSPTCTEEVPAGAVMTAEPGIYLPGKFGVRIEDTIFLTESGNENITKLEKSLLII